MKPDGKFWETKKRGSGGIHLAYISKVQVNGVHAGGPVVENAVFGEIKNTGNHRLLNVEMIVYCLNSDGKPIF